MGDDGSVGRGNRANGLITPFRPMTLEAIAGKNPVSHTGKLYSILAPEIAQRIARELPSVQNVDVYLLSRIGNPIDKPANASVFVDTTQKNFGVIRPKIEQIVDEEIGSVAAMPKKILDGLPM